MALSFDLERELDRLYRLPPAQFSAACDTVAQQAHDEGEDALADRISQLEKPTLSAWVVNQLARENELDIQRLLKGGEQLAAAQLASLEGKGAHRFLEARRDEHDALERLTKGARNLLDCESDSAAIETIKRTIRAAATTPEGRQLLKQGRISRSS